MEEIIILFIIGIVIIVMGVMNMMGNISLIHAHHRKRVSEEDRIPFGKTVGLGTIICGVGMMLNGIFSLIGFFTSLNVFYTIGIILMIVCLVVGLAISFYAMIKYNKGIF